MDPSCSMACALKHLSKKRPKHLLCRHSQSLKCRKKHFGCKITSMFSPLPVFCARARGKPWCCYVFNERLTKFGPNSTKQHLFTPAPIAQIKTFASAACNRWKHRLHAEQHKYRQHLLRRRSSCVKGISASPTLRRLARALHWTETRAMETPKTKANTISIRWKCRMNSVRKAVTAGNT